jgi:hypothetical protein
MAQDDDKAELIAQLAQARATISGNAVALRHDLDFPTRAKNAFKRSPVPWLGGAALLGLIVARLPRRAKKVAPVSAKWKKEPIAEEAGKAGLALGILKIAFNFARPALIRWATQRFSDYVAATQTRKSRDI